jgi:hypothetical protein
MRAIYKWMIDMLQGVREEIKPPVTNNVALIGDFINDHISNVVVVNGTADARTNLVALPTVEPRGELFIRYEPDTKRMYFAVKPFREYCIKRQINYKGILEAFKKTGVFVGATNKRLSKGMKIQAPAVRTLEFDTDHSDFLDVGNAFGVDDGDRDSSVQG